MFFCQRKFLTEYLCFSGFSILFAYNEISSNYHSTFEGILSRGDTGVELGSIGIIRPDLTQFDFNENIIVSKKTLKEIIKNFPFPRKNLLFYRFTVTVLSELCVIF